MAKVQQKSEKISAVGGIFFVLDRFDRILSSVIDSHLGPSSISLENCDALKLYGPCTSFNPCCASGAAGVFNDLPKKERVLCFVELLLWLLATGATPGVGQVLESDAVVLGGVVDVAADGADVFA